MCSSPDAYERGVGLSTQCEQRVRTNVGSDRHGSVASLASDPKVSVVTEMVQHGPRRSDRATRLRAEHAGRSIETAEPVVGDERLMRPQFTRSIHDHRSTLGGVTEFVQVDAD